MRAEVSGGRGERWEVSEHVLWWPPSKIAARWLAPYLALRHDELEEAPAGLPVEVRAPGSPWHETARHHRFGCRREAG